MRIVKIINGTDEWYADKIGEYFVASKFLNKHENKTGYSIVLGQFLGQGVKTEHLKEISTDTKIINEIVSLKKEIKEVSNFFTYACIDGEWNISDKIEKLKEKREKLIDKIREIDKENVQRANTDNR